MTKQMYVLFYALGFAVIGGGVAYFEYNFNGQLNLDTTLFGLDAAKQLLENAVINFAAIGGVIGVVAGMVRQ